jgi:acylphosphatase
MGEARRLGLYGWVRNTISGGVEVWVEGTEEKIAALQAWLHRGPPGARVDSVRLEKCPPTGEYDRFSLRY